MQLGFKSDPKASTKALISNLKDKYADTRSASVFILGYINDQKAVKPLIKILLKDSNAKTRGLAVFALGRIAVWRVDDSVLSPLISALNDNHPSVRGDAASTIAELVRSEIEGPQAIPYLIKLMKDKNAYVQKPAIYALRNINDPRAVEALKNYPHPTAKKNKN